MALRFPEAAFPGSIIVRPAEAIGLLIQLTAMGTTSTTVPACLDSRHHSCTWCFLSRSLVYCFGENNGISHMSILGGYRPVTTRLPTLAALRTVMLLHVSYCLKARRLKPVPSFSRTGTVLSKLLLGSEARLRVTASG